MRTTLRAAAAAALVAGAAAVIPCSQQILCPGGQLGSVTGNTIACQQSGLLTAALAALATATPAGDASITACQAQCDALNVQVAGSCEGIFFGKSVTDLLTATPKCYIIPMGSAAGVIAQLAGTLTAPVAGGGSVQIVCDPSASSTGSSAATSASSAASSGGATSASATSDTAVATSASASATSASGSSSVSSASSSSASASSSAVAQSFPICPQDAGKTFSAQSGSGFSTFRVVCGAGTIGKRSYPAAIEKRQVPGAPLNAFGICITACANSATCASVLFNPLNGACALFDCVITVGPGLSGAVRLTNPGGTPFSAPACPANQPTTVPAQNNNGTVINFNLNLNIDIDVNVDVLAGELDGLPYTQFCRTGKCEECKICKKKPVNECSVCEKKGREPPFKPSKEYCPPGLPGKPGFPGTCTDCEKEYHPAKPDYDNKKPAHPDYDNKGKPDYDNKKPAHPDYDNKGYPAKEDDSKKGKYTGPYSNDAAGLNAMGALIGGAFALAFALA